MSSIVQNKAHVADGLKLLMTQYVDKPNIRAFLEAALEEIQEAEDMMFSVWVARQIDKAVGDALDQWGILVLEPRAARDDDTYRVALIVKFRTMRSKGRTSDIGEIVLLAVGKADAQYYEPIRPGGDGPLARFVVEKNGISATAVRSLLAAIRRGKASGTQGHLVYSTSLASQVLSWAHSSSFATSKRTKWAYTSGTSPAKWAMGEKA